MQAAVIYPHKVEFKNRLGVFFVTIYSTPIKGDPAFTVTWYEVGKRKRKVFTDEGEAHTEAGKIVKRLAGAELKLSPVEAEIYHRALESIRITGIPLDEAAAQFARSWELTGGKVEEAALDFSRQDKSVVVEKSLADAVKEYIEARTQDVSAHYLREYDAKLNALSESFVGYSMAQMEPSKVDDYLRAMKVSSRTRKNARALLLRFFNWARTRKYVPRSFDYKDGIAVVKAHEGDIEIFTVPEMSKLLSNAENFLVPFLAIGAFAGLRHAEIGRLDWSNINFKRKFIEVKPLPSRSGQRVKTKSRRLVPLLPVLEEWLRPHIKASGRVAPREDMTDDLFALAEKAEMKWKHNALRHSFISYRVADIQDVAKVSLECGNTPQVIFSNYRELVEPDAASAWFAIMPPKSPDNVVPMPAQTDPPGIEPRAASR